MLGALVVLPLTGCRSPGFDRNAALVYPHSQLFVVTAMLKTFHAHRLIFLKNEGLCRHRREGLLDLVIPNSG